MYRQSVDAGSYQEQHQPKHDDGANPGADARSQSWTRPPVEKNKQKQNKNNKQNVGRFKNSLVMTLALVLPSADRCLCN